MHDCSKLPHYHNAVPYPVACHPPNYAITFLENNLPGLIEI